MTPDEAAERHNIYEWLRLCARVRDRAEDARDEAIATAEAAWTELDKHDD